MKSARTIQALCGALLLGATTFCSAATVKSVRVWSGPDSTRVVFELTAPVEHRVFTLADPDRIVIDSARHEGRRTVVVAGAKGRRRPGARRRQNGRRPARRARAHQSRESQDVPACPERSVRQSARRRPRPGRRGFGRRASRRDRDRDCARARACDSTRNRAGARPRCDRCDRRGARRRRSRRERPQRHSRERRRHRDRAPSRRGARRAARDACGARARQRLFRAAAQAHRDRARGASGFLHVDPCGCLSRLVARPAPRFMC